MENLSSSEFDVFYSACCNNDIEQVRKTNNESYINQIDADGNTALHIASKNGYKELIQLLFQYHASHTIKNNNGSTAEQLAKNDEIKNLFKIQMKLKEDSEHYIGTKNEVEWIDSYKNAYRIAYENHGHMKQWLLKVPFIKLLEELKTGYIDKMEFSSSANTETIQKLSRTVNSKKPKELVEMYTSAGTLFCTKLNYDLAQIGSDFRFLSTQNLFNSGYLDNEPPKGLGQHIFAAILINHPYFQSFYKTGTTYRGMSITRGELAQYKKGDIVLTRSFLSTTKDKSVLQIYEAQKEEERIPIICTYTVINPHTSLHIEEISTFQEEEEVLIAPFAVFRVTEIEGLNENEQNKSNCVTISFLEVDSNLL